MSRQKGAGSRGEAALTAIKRYVGGGACYHQFPRMSLLGNLVNRVVRACSQPLTSLLLLVIVTIVPIHRTSPEKGNKDFGTRELDSNASRDGRDLHREAVHTRIQGIIAKEGRRPWTLGRGNIRRWGPLRSIVPLRPRRVKLTGESTLFRTITRPPRKKTSGISSSVRGSCPSPRS